MLVHSQNCKQSIATHTLRSIFHAVHPSQMPDIWKNKNQPC